MQLALGDGATRGQPAPPGPRGMRQARTVIVATRPGNSAQWRAARAVKGNRPREQRGPKLTPGAEYTQRQLCITDGLAMVVLQLFYPNDSVPNHASPPVLSLFGMGVYPNVIRTSSGFSRFSSRPGHDPCHAYRIRQSGASHAVASRCCAIGKLMSRIPHQTDVTRRRFRRPDTARRPERMPARGLDGVQRYCA